MCCAFSTFVLAFIVVYLSSIITYIYRFIFCLWLYYVVFVMAQTTTVRADKTQDKSFDTTHRRPFPRLLTVPIEERYHESRDYPVPPLDDSDVMLEVFFPLSGTHIFRNITSFLILFVPHINTAENTMLWHRECRDRDRVYGSQSRTHFITDLYVHNVSPATFVQDMRRLYPSLIHTFRYQSIDTGP